MSEWDAYNRIVLRSAIRGDKVVIRADWLHNMHVANGKIVRSPLPREANEYADKLQSQPLPPPPGVAVPAPLP